VRVGKFFLFCAFGGRVCGHARAKGEGQMGQAKAETAILTTKLVFFGRGI
jgi:hypothetical protein